MKYNYIIFDWDGCLAQTLDIWLQGFKKTYADYNIHLSDRDISSLLNDVDGPSKKGISDQPEFFGKLEKYMYAAMHQEVPLYDSVKKALTDLKKNHVSLAIFTTSHKILVNPIMKRHHIDQYFDAIITGKDVIKHKPDSEGIFKAMKLLGAQPDQTLMVGDSDKDIEAANNANIDSALYYPDSHQLYYNKEHLTSFNPTYTFSHFSQFTHLID